MGMRYKLLGRTGLRVSELCLGAMIFGDRRGGWGASKDEAARSVERDLLPMAQALELSVTAWSPLGGGLLTGRYGTDREQPSDTPKFTHRHGPACGAWPSKEEAMTETTPAAERRQAITPHLVVRGAAAASEWYQRALGAKERGRIPVPDGKFMQIDLRFGDSTVMISDEFPDLGVVSPLSLGGTVGALAIHTDDVDALWQRAVEAGAEVSHPLQDMFWGDRHGEIFDPFGHRWALAQHLRDVPADEIRAAAAAMFEGEPP
jgi:PhnB protein